MSHLPRLYSSEYRPVIYIHIPKVAGTTMHSIMRRQYLDRAFAVYPFQLLHYGMLRMAKSDKRRILDKGLADWQVEDFERIPEPLANNLELVFGHVPYGVGNHIKRKEQACTYATLLREPVQRVISDYYFSLQRKTVPLEQGQPISIEKWIARFPGKGSNSQVRWLCGTMGEDGQSLVYSQQHCTEKELSLAKQRLTDEIVFGIVEDFHRSLVLLAKSLNWSYPPYYYVKNKTRYRPKHNQLSEDTLTFIQEKNSLDQVLYEFAHQLFLDRWASLGPGMEEVLEQFQEDNQRYGKRYEIFHTCIYWPWTLLKATGAVQDERKK